MKYHFFSKSRSADLRVEGVAKIRTKSNKVSKSRSPDRLLLSSQRRGGDLWILDWGRDHSILGAVQIVYIIVFHIVQNTKYKIQNTSNKIQYTLNLTQLCYWYSLKKNGQQYLLLVEISGYEKGAQGVITPSAPTYTIA